MRLRDITPTNANTQVKHEIQRFVERRLATINNQREWLEMLKEAYEFEHEKMEGYVKQEILKQARGY